MSDARLLSPLTEQEAAEYRRRIQRGFGELRRLCAGRFRYVSDTALHAAGERGRDFTMTIPVQDDDSDVVLYNALEAAEELLKMYGPLGAAPEETQP